MTRTLRVLQVFNEYRRYGGEDAVVDLEAALLRRNGHAVECLKASTKELDDASHLRLLTAGFGTVWSFRGYAAMRRAISDFCPDIVHAHNTFPLLSSSVFWAAHRAGVPVVQTLHNYRLTCANSLLLREEKACEECVGHFPWAGLRHRCFGASLFRTSAVTSANLAHRWMGTFEDKIDAYIALTDFSKEVMTRAGLPRDRIYVKPNFAVDSVRAPQPRLSRVLFAGIVARFKGVHVLLESWTRLALAGYQLLIVGDGPERQDLERRYRDDSSIVWCGMQTRDAVTGLMAASRWVVLPSLVYENFPMTVLEAFSVGTPVVVPNHGAFAAIVADRQQGLLFSPGNAESLTATLRAALTAPNRSWTGWSTGARQKFLGEFNEQTNYLQLLAIYQKARETFGISQGAVCRTEMRKGAQPIGA